MKASKPVEKIVRPMEGLLNRLEPRGMSLKIHSTASIDVFYTYQNKLGCHWRASKPVGTIFHTIGRLLHQPGRPGMPLKDFQTN